MKSFRSLLLIALLAPAALAASTPYEILRQSYSPYMSAEDPLGFAMKIHSIAIDPYRFWRGSKDLFFVWCKINTTDWLGDRSSYLPNHGDLHLGNIGTYVPADGWGKLAFGMIDFDDSTVLPFQIELLQGLITLKVTAQANGIAYDDEKLASAMFEAYRFAVNSQRNATAMLVDNQTKTVVKMLARQSLDYSHELKEYAENGKFRTAVYSDKGKLKDILRPAMQRADGFAGGIAQAIVNEPDLKKVLRFESADEVRAAIKDICQRSRLGSSGSQGLEKFLVLMDKPLRGVDSDAVLYLKQEIPTAAERQGVGDRSKFTPGQRMKTDIDRLTDPIPYLNSWCEVGSESFWVALKDPWSDELNPDDIKTLNDLMGIAKVWGTVAGATHREQGRFELILPKLTPQLLTQLRERSDAYVAVLEKNFQDFQSDPHVKEQVDRAEAAIKPYEKK